jgi:cyanophycinase
VNNETDSSNSDSIRRIKGAHAVFFTGGDQQKLIAILAKTELLATIKRKYFSDKHFIVGGTSAGAMVIPETCIANGTIREALFKNDITIVEGFGLIKNIIVDTHFVKRGRFARLAQAVTMHPNCLGIGLEENTAIIISQGYKIECIGSGMVTLIDGSKLTKTNINAVNDSTPIVMNNLKVSILAKGSKLHLKK